MSKTSEVTNRLSAIEGEILKLLDIQKKHNDECRKPRSASKFHSPKKSEDSASQICTKTPDTNLQLTQLTSEIICLRNLVLELKADRNTALEAVKKWKEKFNEAKDCKCSCKHTWHDMLAEKEALSNALEQEKLNLQIAQKKLKSLANQEECYKELKIKYDELLNKKNADFYDLLEKNEHLAQVCNEITEELNITRQKYKDLEDTNKAFATDLVKKYEDLKAQAKNNEKLHQNKAQVFNNKLRKQNQKTDKRLQKEKETNAELRQKIETLQKQTELTELQEEYKKYQLDAEKTIELLKNERGRVMKNCVDLRDEVSDKQADLSLCNAKITALESDLNRSEQRENALLLDMAQQKSLVEELTGLLAQHKNRIDELAALNDGLMDASGDRERAVELKSRQLAEARRELEIVCAKYEAMETYVGSFKVTRDAEVEIKELRESLREELDTIRIKDKILTDQTNTIISLKKKIAEKDEVIASLHREISMTKRDMEDLNNRISEVQQERNSLYKELSIAQDELQKHQVVIEDLERKADLQDQEWRLQKELYHKETERAVNAAKFATEKLTETMDDFQKQTESQNKVRSALTGLLQQKDAKLREAISQMSSLTLDPEKVFRNLIDRYSYFGDESDCDSIRFGCFGRPTRRRKRHLSLPPKRSAKHCEYGMCYGDTSSAPSSICCGLTNNSSLSGCAHFKCY